MNKVCASGMQPSPKHHKDQEQNERNRQKTYVNNRTIRIKRSFYDNLPLQLTIHYVDGKSNRRNMINEFGLKCIWKCEKTNTNPLLTMYHANVSGQKTVAEKMVFIFIDDRKKRGKLHSALSRIDQQHYLHTHTCTHSRTSTLMSF